jgi:ribA/ribD-fused uncharacterized protein
MTKNEVIELGFFNSRRYLSNLYLSSIKYRGLVYPSVENAYQASKVCKTQEERELFTKYSPSEAKKLAKEMSIRESFDDHKTIIMYSLVLIKFSTHKDLLDKLLQTGDSVLVEYNYWGDNFWGKHFGSSQGQNRLGIILMHVREILGSSIYS